MEDSKLTELFAPFGEVKHAEVVKDMFTGQSRGFGYVEMEDEAAEKAISQLNQTTFNDKVITVKEAAPKIEHKGSYKVGNGAVNAYKFKKN